MNIDDISRLNNGDAIEFTGLVSDLRTGQKKDGNPFLIVIIQDRTGSISFPIWDNLERFREIVEKSPILNVKGTAGSFNGAVQIKNPSVKPAAGGLNASDFVPSYEISDELVEYFNAIVDSLEDKYRQIAVAATGAFGTNKERWDAFYSCVAAEKFHGNKRGGLFIHTIGVMKTMESLLSNYIANPFFMDAKEVISRDRLMLKAILHDLMKAEEYEYETAIRRKCIKMDHLVLGAAYVREINNECGGVLSPEELDDICYSILSHHGEFGNYPTKSIEDILLNQADLIDSQIVNAVENKI
ncbi:MAG: phosphohydrolase [Firmicutes bacterium]|nr:phosphohydrolase [Bacillota bacterium]